MSDPHTGQPHTSGQPAPSAAAPVRTRHAYPLEDLLDYIATQPAQPDEPAYLTYRRRLYAQLRADGEIHNLLHRVRTGAMAIESLETATRLMFNWHSHYGDEAGGPPQWTVGDFAKMITADYDFMLRAFMRQWGMEGISAKKQAEQQIHTAAMTAAAAVEVASLASEPEQIGDYDLVMLYAHAWAQQAIHAAAEVVEGFVDTDNFRKLMMSEARALADMVNQAVIDHPGVLRAVAVGHYGSYRIPQLIGKAQKMMRGEFVEGVTDDPEQDEEKKRRDLNEELGQTIQALAAEKEIGGALCEEKNAVVLEAGQTIADFLKGLAISTAEQEQGQGVDADSGSTGENGEEEQKEASLQDVEKLSFTVYVNQRKQQLRIAQIAAAVQMGKQVAFTSKQDMKRFNEATEGKFAGQVTAMTPEQQKALGNKAPPHAKLLEAEFDDMLRHQRAGKKARGADLNNNGIPDHLEQQNKDQQREQEHEQEQQAKQQQRQQRREARQQRREERRAQRSESTRRSQDLNNDGIPDHLQQGGRSSSQRPPSPPRTRRSDATQHDDHHEERQQRREERQQRREERRAQRIDQHAHDGEHKSQAPKEKAPKSSGKVKMSDVIGEVKMGSHMQVKSNAMTSNPTPPAKDTQIQR